MPKQKPSGSQLTFRSNSDIAIHVPDLALTEAFYGNVLGFQVLNRSDRQLAFDTGVFQLYVNLDETPRSYIPSFDVPNFAVAKSHLEAAGCKTVEVGPVTYFQDPFGFIFDIIERR